MITRNQFQLFLLNPWTLLIIIAIAGVIVGFVIANLFYGMPIVDAISTITLLLVILIVTIIGDISRYARELEEEKKVGP